MSGLWPPQDQRGRLVPSRDSHVVRLSSVGWGGVASSQVPGLTLHLPAGPPRLPRLLPGGDPRYSGSTRQRTEESPGSLELEILSPRAGNFPQVKILWNQARWACLESQLLGRPRQEDWELRCPARKNETDQNRNRQHICPNLEALRSTLFNR